MFGRVREPEEVAGIFQDIVLARAKDPQLHEVGQDGGLVSALLVYTLEHDIIDAALVSYLDGDGSTWKAVPGVARNREDVIRSAGSRYTYSANTLAYPEAVEGGADRIALVGMSCMSSIPAVAKTRKVGKVARRLSLNIGLLCSKTFDDAIFDELFNVREIWIEARGYQEGEHQRCVPNLDAQQQLTTRCRSRNATRGLKGCNHCPDFAAEHADISTGGIGAFNDWTLTIIRTMRAVISWTG